MSVQETVVTSVILFSSQSRDIVRYLVTFVDLQSFGRLLCTHSFFKKTFYSGEGINYRFLLCALHVNRFVKSCHNTLFEENFNKLYRNKFGPFSQSTGFDISQFNLPVLDDILYFAQHPHKPDSWTINSREVYKHEKWIKDLGAPAYRFTKKDKKRKRQNRARVFQEEEIKRLRQLVEEQKSEIAALKVIILEKSPKEAVIIGVMNNSHSHITMNAIMDPKNVPALEY